MEEKMSHVLAITFEDETQGPACLRTIKSLRDHGQLKINDAAVVVKDAEGKVKVDNMVESGVKEGALIGGFVGLLLASVFFPLAGIALGAGGGALIGKTLNTGLDKKFITDVQDSIKPGNSAVLFIVNHENVGLLITALEPYKGQIFQSSFDSEAEEEIKRSLK
jgi:uncharacterized membrane protein